MLPSLGTNPIRHRLLPTGARATNIRNTVASCQEAEPFIRARDHLVPLPDGGGFLLPCTNDLFGPGYAFRMTSSASFDEDTGFGLVLYEAPRPPIVSDKGRSGAQVIVYRAGVSHAEFEQAEGGGNVFAGLLPQPEIAGVLPRPSEEASTEETSQAHDRLFVGRDSESPRRSLKLQFTCNRCDTRNVASVNPFAWRYGTVFIECGGCKVKHKMVDHLNVAEEVGITAGEMDLSQQERIRHMMSDVKIQAPK